MFFRTKTVRGTAVLQLVESYRNPEGLPRQRVLASLGDAAVPLEERGAIAKIVEMRLRCEDALLPIRLSREAAEWAARIQKIVEQSCAVALTPGTTRLDGVAVDRIRIDHIVGFDEHGFALAHEVFEGNIADTKTLLAMLDRLDLGDEGLKPVVTLDAGFASEANIKLLEERGCSYIVNITRGSRTRYAEYFEKETFSPLPGRKTDKQVEVKRIVDPENNDRRLVLCRSALRREKERAMISKAVKSDSLPTETLCDGALKKGSSKNRM